MSTADRSRAHYNRARRYARDGYAAKGSKALAFGAVAIEWIECPALCDGVGRYAYSADGAKPADPRECRVCRGAKRIDGALYDEWKKDADYASYASVYMTPAGYGRVSLEDYNTLKSKAGRTRFENTLGDYIRDNSYLLIERAAPSTGARCPNHVCRDGKVPGRETCRVCDGRGTISTEEHTAWMQDTGYVDSLRSSYPKTYSGFCDRERREYIEREALQGRFPSTTLFEFIRDRRRGLRIPEIKEKLIDFSVGRGEIRMKCPRECNYGVYAPFWYSPDVDEKCRMCAPFGGTGTIPAKELAAWMSDPEYRTYYNATQPQDRVSRAEWQEQRERRDPTKRAERAEKDDRAARTEKVKKVNKVNSKESRKKRNGQSGGCCCS